MTGEGTQPRAVFENSPVESSRMRMLVSRSLICHLSKVFPRRANLREAPASLPDQPLLPQWLLERTTAEELPVSVSFTMEAAWAAAWEGLPLCIQLIQALGVVSERISGFHGTGGSDFSLL